MLWYFSCIHKAFFDNEYTLECATIVLKKKKRWREGSNFSEKPRVCIYISVSEKTHNFYVRMMRLNCARCTLKALRASDQRVDWDVIPDKRDESSRLQFYVYNRKYHWCGKHRWRVILKNLEREWSHNFPHGDVFVNFALNKNKQKKHGTGCYTSRLLLEKRAQIIGPPVHSVSIFHTCTNTYKVTNTQRTHPHAHTHSHTWAWLSIHRILFRRQAESEGTTPVEKSKWSQSMSL